MKHTTTSTKMKVAKVRAELKTFGTADLKSHRYDSQLQLVMEQQFRSCVVFRKLEYSSAIIIFRSTLTFNDDV